MTAPDTNAADLMREQFEKQRGITADAITGALAFGSQNTNPPSPGHWLEPFWNIGRSEANDRALLELGLSVFKTHAVALLNHPLLLDVLGYIEDAGPADVWAAAQSWMALREANYDVAAPIPRDPVGWQDIATAPKDGTHILAILPDRDSCYVICWADAAKDIRKNLGPDVGWHMAYDADFLQQWDEPTHWQPLPVPPAIRALPTKEAP